MLFLFVVVVIEFEMGLLTSCDTELFDCAASWYGVLLLLGLPLLKGCICGRKKGDAVGEVKQDSFGWPNSCQSPLWVEQTRLLLTKLAKQLMLMWPAKACLAQLEAQPRRGNVLGLG